MQGTSSMLPRGALFHSICALVCVSLAVRAHANNIVIDVTADPPANGGTTYVDGEVVRVAVRLRSETTPVTSLTLVQVDVGLVNATLVAQFDPDDATNPITDSVIFGGGAPGDGQMQGANADAYSGPALPGCPSGCLVGSVPSANPPPPVGTGPSTIYFWLRTNTSASSLLSLPTTRPGVLFIQFKIQFSGPGQSIVDVLGPCADDGSSSGAFARQDQTGMRWANCDPLTGPDPNNQNNFVGGSLNMTVTPLPLIASANPPADNPYLAGPQPFRDVLQTGTTSALQQGIGSCLTPGEGPVNYCTVAVTFSFPTALAASDVSIACSYAGTPPGSTPCPVVTEVEGSGAGPYTIALSGPIPPGGCATLTFGNAAPGQALQYEYLPGDVSMDGQSNTIDLLRLVEGLNEGVANRPANLARYDMNRSGIVNTTDLLRLVQLLNGVNTTQVWNGAAVVPCL